MVAGIIAVVSQFIEAFGVAKTIGTIIAAVLVGTGVVYGPQILNALSSTPNALTILTHIQNEANLDTVRANYTIQVSSGIIDGNFGTLSYNGEYRGDGEIIAGIDLGLLTQSDIEYNQNPATLNIKLPPPQFTICAITNFQQISSSITLFPADWDILYRLASVDAYNSLTEQGVENGLLEQAEQEAGRILTEMLLGKFPEIAPEAISITYATMNRGQNSDTSCTPVFPQGWCKEDRNHSWIHC
jgi:hypothetical protein